MPENIKKELTALGDGVLRNLDTINSLTVKEQNVIFPFFDGYLQNTYNLSDEFRKIWRLDAVYPSNVEDLRLRLVERFPNPDDISKDVVRKRFVDEFRRYKPTYLPVSEIPVSQLQIKEEVNKIINERSTARKGRRA